MVTLDHVENNQQFSTVFLSVFAAVRTVLLVDSVFDKLSSYEFMMTVRTRL